MTITEQHWQKLKQCAENVDSTIVANWFLHNGYFPEKYVLPACFSSGDFILLDDRKNEHADLKEKELAEIIIPNEGTSDRIFGVMHPDIYHDLVWETKNNWRDIVNHLFSEDNKIFSYSFPLPFNLETGELSEDESGAQIKGYLDMVEKDLIADSAGYKFVLHADIKNCYPSMYTHSIPWALHGKDKIRKLQNRCKEEFLGNRLDKLMHYGNDACTNGIPIGSTFYHLICEIILSAVDRDLSLDLGINFIGARFRDDYRILCKTREDANKILQHLKKHLKTYHLSINDSKTKIIDLPHGLFRPWKLQYAKITSFLRGEDREISLNEFEMMYFEALDVNKQFPEKGTIDMLLGNCTKNNKILIKLSDIGEIGHLKFINLLWHLVHIRPKCFPTVLGIIEILLKESLIDQSDILRLFSDLEKNPYFVSWVIYFLKLNNIAIPAELIAGVDDKFILSVYQDENLLFPNTDYSPFKSINTLDDSLIDQVSLANYY